jgi:hypothetical protein
MVRPTALDVRELILTVALEQEPKHQFDASLQQGTLFQAVAQRLGQGTDPDLEQAILTQWHDVMRTGYFAWGLNLSNPNPPFFHFTDRGRRALARLTRDPGNPAGYLRHLSDVVKLNPVAHSQPIKPL